MLIAGTLLIRYLSSVCVCVCVCVCVLGAEFSASYNSKDMNRDGSNSNSSSFCILFLDFQKSFQFHSNYIAYILDKCIFAQCRGRY